MLEEIKNVYRYNLYKDCRILVNDLTEVIKELQIFLDKKFYPFVKESGKRIVLSNIEITYEDERIVWRIFDRNDSDVENIIKLDEFSIEDNFPGKEEYMLEIKQTMENFPRELYAKSLLCFTDALAKFIYDDEFIKEPFKVFDICWLDNNGENNIIYEIREE